MKLKRIKIFKDKIKEIKPRYTYKLFKIFYIFEIF